MTLDELKAKFSQTTDYAEHSSPVAMWDIPCSRHDSGREDIRVRCALAFACGVLGNDAVADKLTRVHDHKGNLYVMYRAALTDAEKAAFRSAWNACYEEDVDFFVHDGEDAASILKRVREPVLSSDEFANLVQHTSVSISQSSIYVR